MPNFNIRYTEIVVYEATIEATDEREAKEKLKNGDYTDVFETDSFLEHILSIKLEK